ncbi:MAG: FAD-binding oxidoreductase, partial [Emcibacter sp.]|nr:FAD-binding oxidoreductase [Emcibacter sp.]
DPGRYLEILTQYFQSLGGELVQAEAEDFIIENNQIKAVQTAGRTIDCASLVLTAGVWSGVLATKLGLTVPLESEGGYHIELVNPSFMPKVPTLFAAAKFVATPMEGRLRCAGIVEFAGLDAPENNKASDFLLKRVKEVFPTLRWTDIRTWRGHRPSTPDSLPVIGPSEKIKNVYFAFGHQHVGLGSGPRTGLIIADIIEGKKPAIDITPFRPNRF